MDGVSNLTGNRFDSAQAEIYDDVWRTANVRKAHGTEGRTNFVRNEIERGFLRGPKGEPQGSGE
jgi:hypothetical protein